MKIKIFLKYNDGIYVLIGMSGSYLQFVFLFMFLLFVTVTKRRTDDLRGPGRPRETTFLCGRS